MTQIPNPILKGFNPDPSIVRVGDDYFIATSTFEWFPGVQIHHSKDLIHWELITRPLNRISQLEMKGNPDSCGVWAPCLSYHEGTYYLVYSNVRSFDGVWKDTPNFLVTTNDIRGDWSEPVFLNSSGFDGSMFHDENGKHWYVSMLVDHRRGKFFGGIILQEYSVDEKRLVGDIHYIYEGTSLGLTEGPHLYRRGEYYYLLTAEGGTEYGHAVSFARSKSIFGPYVDHPENPMISNRDNPKAVLQKCGHGDLVETPSGDWYSVFLVGRPLSEHGRCPLGRETAIAEIEWRADDWLYLKNDNIRAGESIVEAEAARNEQLVQFDNFDTPDLSIHFQSLRVPMDASWLSLGQREGYLRLYGRESLNSFHEQSLVARRVQHFELEVSTCLEFEPQHFQHMAGLVCYYNTGHWYYLHVLGDDIGRHSGKKFLQITGNDNYATTEYLSSPPEISDSKRIFLKANTSYGRLQFYYALEEDEWMKVGPDLDFSILSDDYVRDGSERYRPAFTGAFVGICCQDLSGNHHPADFDWFSYTENY